MTTGKSGKRPYHHGNLAESLLDAVDELATRFGLEAVSLRGCARLIGVAPSSAFRHYADKRALLTAFATRALNQLSEAMVTARVRSEQTGADTLRAVGARLRGVRHRQARFLPRHVASGSYLLQRPRLRSRGESTEPTLDGGGLPTPSRTRTPIASAPRSYSPGLQCMDWRACSSTDPSRRTRARTGRWRRAAEMLEAMGPVFRPPRAKPVLAAASAERMF